MTNKQTTFELILLIVGISVFIFLSPLLTGSKQPSIEASVKQNMDFLNEMVKKYIEKHKKPPLNLDVLVTDARNNRYNKTFFNPILKNTGDGIDRQIIENYSPAIYQSLNENFQGIQYSGKVGYFQNGVQYAIYGHITEGKLLKQNNKILVLSNQ